jgi:hypothetical protein
MNAIYVLVCYTDDYIDFRYGTPDVAYADRIEAEIAAADLRKVGYKVEVCEILLHGTPSQTPSYHHLNEFYQ